MDTNVWAWDHCPSSYVTPSGTIVPQAKEYRPYLALLRAVGANRHHIGLSLAELAHLIEKNELKVYSLAVSPLTTKEYRHTLPSERARVVKEVEQAWTRIKADSVPLSLTLDDAVSDAALARFAAALVDGYDLFLLEAMAASNVTRILTDDGDFCTHPDIEMFTANPRVLAAARAQGRLVVR